MNYRNLGKTGLKLSALSYGTWQTFAETVDDATADTIVTTAYDLGVRCFDGAEAYASGKADAMMGRVLAQKDWNRESYVLTGKCISSGSEDWQSGISRKRLVECCDRTLKNLHSDYLDLYFCHRPDGQTPPEEVVITMNALIQQGKILYWGTSMFDPLTLERMWQFADRHGLAGPVVEQSHYNLLSRERLEVDLKPVMEKWGMGCTVYSPIAVGQLSGKYNDGVPENTRLADEEWLRKQLTDERLAQLRSIQKIADDLGVQMASLAYAWVLKNPLVSTAIMGARRPDQIERNVQALEVLDQLTPEVLTALDNAVTAE
jgi:voltage-dependent potassium channel beta subunit